MRTAYSYHYAPTDEEKARGIREIVDAQRTHTLYRAGDTSPFAYRLRTGTIILIKHMMRHTRRPISMGAVRDKEFFGEEPLLGLPREHTAIAINDCIVEVLEWWRDELLLLAARRRSILLEKLAILRGPQRLIAVLSAYAGTPLRTTDIAELAWLSRETTQRLLNKQGGLRDEDGDPVNVLMSRENARWVFHVKKRKE